MTDGTEAKTEQIKNLGWRVAFAGMGINLALGILYTWSVIGKRMRRRRPLPEMPPNARAIPLAALVATIVGAVAFVAGGLLEWVAPRYFPTEVSWGLRTLWHVACAFGASYCLFLRRLLHVLQA